jgi:hypothetical protein
MRTLWNEFTSRKWCEYAGQQLLICTAVDQIANKWLTTYEKYHFALHCSRQTNTNTRLPDKVELARGMKVLVTNNIGPDLDITNGARGEIVDIILNPAEPDLLPKPIVQLRTASLIAYLQDRRDWQRRD